MLCKEEPYREPRCTRSSFAARYNCILTGSCACTCARRGTWYSGHHCYCRHTAWQLFGGQILTEFFAESWAGLLCHTARGTSADPNAADQYGVEAYLSSHAGLFSGRLSLPERQRLPRRYGGAGSALLTKPGRGRDLSTQAGRRCSLYGGQGNDSQGDGRAVSDEHVCRARQRWQGALDLGNLRRPCEYVGPGYSQQRRLFYLPARAEPVQAVRAAGRDGKARLV